MLAKIEHSNIEESLKYVIQNIVPNRNSFLIEVRNVQNHNFLFSIIDAAQVEITEKFCFALEINHLNIKNNDKLEELTFKLKNLGFKEFTEDDLARYILFCGKDIIKTGQSIQTLLREIYGLSFTDHFLISTTNLGSMTHVQHLTNVLLQSLHRRDTKLPDSSVIKEYLTKTKSIRDETKILKLQISDLSAAQIENQEFQKLILQQEKEVQLIETSLDKFAPRLGKAAYFACMAGNLTKTPDYDARIELQERIEKLKNDHQALSPNPDGGFFAKAKAVAQQLIVAGKLKIEEFRVEGVESVLGKKLIELNRDSELESSQTIDLLAELRNFREQQKEKRKSLAELLSKFEFRKVSWSRDFGIDFGNGKLDFSKIIKEFEQKLQTLNEKSEAIQNQFVNQLIYDVSVQPGTSIGDIVEKLRKLKRESESSRQNSTSNEKSPSNSQNKKSVANSTTLIQSWSVPASNEYCAFKIFNEVPALQFENWQIDGSYITAVLMYEPSLMRKIEDGLETVATFGLNKMLLGKTYLESYQIRIYFFDKDQIEVDEGGFFGPSEFKQGNKHKIKISLPYDSKNDLGKVVIRWAGHKRR